MKSILRKIPILNSFAKITYFTLVAPFKKFPGSKDYWQKRYESGGNSGAGSYRRLSHFKAQTLNNFVKDNKITSIIEYGCGDGNQLKLSEYPQYIGFDVSPEAIALCENIFIDDPTKTFKLTSAYEHDTAQLTLSLDVIYHLVEYNVFTHYMERLFNSSEKFVIIYSSNTNKQARLQAAHVRHRKFSTWIETKTGWQLTHHIPNIHPDTGDDQEGSFADFYIYKKTS